MCVDFPLVVGLNVLLMRLKVLFFIVRMKFVTIFVG